MSQVFDAKTMAYGKAYLAVQKMTNSWFAKLRAANDGPAALRSLHRYEMMLDGCLDRNDPAKVFSEFRLQLNSVDDLKLKLRLFRWARRLNDEFGQELELESSAPKATSALDMDPERVSVSAVGPAGQSTSEPTTADPTALPPITTPARNAPPSTTPRPGPNQSTPGFNSGRHSSPALPGSSPALPGSSPALPGSSPANSGRDTDKKRRSSPSTSTGAERGAPPAPKRARTSSDRSLRPKAGRTPVPRGNFQRPFGKRTRTRKQDPASNAPAPPPVDQPSALHALVKLEPMEETEEQLVLKPAVTPILGAEKTIEVTAPATSRPTDETQQHHINKPAGTLATAVPPSVATEAEQTNAAAQQATKNPSGDQVATGATPETTETDISRPEQIELAVRPAATMPVAASTPAATRIADGAPFTPPATGKKDVNAPAANSAPSAMPVLTQRSRSMSPTDGRVRRRTSTGHTTGSSLLDRDGARIGSTDPQLEVAKMDLIMAMADIRPLKGTKDHVEPTDSGAATGSISSNEPNSNLDFMRRQAWAALKGRTITYKAGNKEMEETIPGKGASKIVDAFFGKKWVGGCVERIIDIVQSTENFNDAVSLGRAIESTENVPGELRSVLRCLHFVKQNDQSETIKSLKAYMGLVSFGRSWEAVRRIFGPDGDPDRRNALRSFCFGSGNHAAKTFTQSLKAAKDKLCNLAGIHGASFERTRECTHLPIAIVDHFGFGGLLFLPASIKDPAPHIWERRTGISTILEIIDGVGLGTGNWLGVAAQAMGEHIVGRLVDGEALAWPQHVLEDLLTRGGSRMPILGAIDILKQAGQELQRSGGTAAIEELVGSGDDDVGVRQENEMPNEESMHE